MATINADDLIAAEPPRAFPPWMVEADPRLAAQETNGLYLALRRRRLVHRRGRSWSDWWRRGWEMPRWVITASSVGALLVVGMPMVDVMGAFAVIPLMVLFIIAMVYIAPLYAASARLADAGLCGRVPSTWTDALSREGSEDYLRAMFLAWSVGARGRDVLEAVYLEEREVTLAAATPATIVFLLLGLGLAWTVVVVAGEHGSMPWFLACLIILMASASTRMVWASVKKRRASPAARDVLRRWRAGLAPLLLHHQHDRPQLPPLPNWAFAIPIVTALVGIGWLIEGAYGNGASIYFANIVTMLMLIGADRLVRWQGRNDDAHLALMLDEADVAFEFVAGLLATGERVDETRAYLARMAPPPDPMLTDESKADDSLSPPSPDHDQGTRP